MRVVPRRTLWSFALVAGLGLVLAALAVLQYRWVGQLTEDRQVILRSRLENSVEIFRRAFTFELMEPGGEFRRGVRPGGPPEDFATDAAQRYMRWKRTAFHPGMAKGLYVRTLDSPGQAQLRRYDESLEEFVPVSTPPAWLGLLEQCSSPGPGRGGPGEERRVPVMWRFARDQGHALLLRSAPGRPPGGPSGPPGAPPGFRGAPGPPRRARPPMRQFDLVLELDEEYLLRTLIPDLVVRAFGDDVQADYDIAVFEGRSAGRPEPVFGPGETFRDGEPPDVRVGLFMGPVLPAPRRGAAAAVPDRRESPIGSCGEEAQWELWVRHRSGSVAQEVQRYRYRNLALSAGVLFLLSSSIVLLVVFTQRAQRLAKQQMDFAAGVSHELRTPLTIISSAADNLADGTVTDEETLLEYGRLIQRESRRLAGMVEEALEFAAVHSGGRRLEIEVVDAAASIREALRLTEAARTEAGIVLEEDLDPCLPMVRADAAALARCVQNLIANAMKYGAEGRWIGVRAAGSRDPRHPFVMVSVADRGPGIQPEDLPLIFDPFYQGASNRGVKRAGVGLGLSLTKETMRAMGGDVSVESEPGKGACFTLHIPKVNSDEEAHPAG